MGTPGSPYSRKCGHPGAYIYVNMGIRGAHFWGCLYSLDTGTIFGGRKWSPRTNYGCHKRSPPAITCPGRTIRGKIIVKKGSGTIVGCRLILRSRNVLAIYELPSSNEDQMEFRYKHWCGRAERGRTRAPPCRRYSGGTSYGAGGPVMARRNWSPMRPDHNPQPGPL